MYRKQVRRRRAILALLVIGSFALLTITYGQGSNGFQRGVSTIFSPVQAVASRALKPARDLVNWVDETFEARGRNSRLHGELEQERRLAVGASAALAENAQLRKLLSLDRTGAIPAGYRPVSGRVISRSPTSWFADVEIDVGTDRGVRVNDPVVDGDGLVGTVSSVTGHSAQVALIADGSSAVSARVVPTGALGVIEPEVGNPGSLVLAFIKPGKHSIHRGEPVVTAGWRGGAVASRFPPNIAIGEVTRAPLNEQEAKQQVHVHPYADLANLDFVQVWTGNSRE